MHTVFLGEGLLAEDIYLYPSYPPLAIFLDFGGIDVAIFHIMNFDSLDVVHVLLF